MSSAVTSIIESLKVILQSAITSAGEIPNLLASFKVIGATLLTKLFSILLSIMYFFTPYVGPSTAQPIEAVNPDDAKLVVVAMADPQISSYAPKRDAYFRASCDDIKNAKADIDALLIAGDIAENGLECEYDRIFELISDSKVKNYILSVGNHDVRLRNYKDTVERFTTFTNSLNEKAGSPLRIDALNYSYEINGYTFIVLGTDRTEFEESYISEQQLNWLDSSLKQATAQGKPAFVVIHQTFKDTHGLPGTWNSPIDAAGSVGRQSAQLYEVMNRYNNVVLISGHLHTGFGQYTYEKLGNINSVNLPSVTVNNADGVYNENGIGYMMEVYNDKVLFRARNFAQGIYVPECDFTIDLV